MRTFGCVCVWVECGWKTDRSSFCLRGHPQTPVGDAPTEMPTNLKVVSRNKAKGTKCKLLARL